MKGLMVGNIAFLLTACVSLGIYLATINQHSKTLEDTTKAMSLIEIKTEAIDKALHKRISDVAESGLVRDNVNEKSVIAIEGKLGRIEDKLDSALTDLKDIKKIVLKPAVGSVSRHSYFNIADSK